VASLPRYFVGTFLASTYLPAYSLNLREQFMDSLDRKLACFLAR
jgi:hypothetical protein